MGDGSGNRNNDLLGLNWECSTPAKHPEVGSTHKQRVFLDSSRLSIRTGSLLWPKIQRRLGKSEKIKLKTHKMKSYKKIVTGCFVLCSLRLKGGGCNSDSLHVLSHVMSLSVI